MIRRRNGHRRTSAYRYYHIALGGFVAVLLCSNSIGGGRFIDSMVFYPIAFYGVWKASTPIEVIIFNGCLKASVETLCTPLTYLVVHGLKRAEHEDHFDVGTNFAPFSLE